MLGMYLPRRRLFLSTASSFESYLPNAGIPFSSLKHAQVEFILQRLLCKTTFVGFQANLCR